MDDRDRTKDLLFDLTALVYTLLELGATCDTIENAVEDGFSDYELDQVED